MDDTSMDDADVFSANLDATPSPTENPYGPESWSLDWPRLRISRRASLDVLSRFEAAGLSLYSIKIAEAISPLPASLSAAYTCIHQQYLAHFDSTNPVHRALTDTGSPDILPFLGLFACLHPYYSLTSIVDCFVELARAVHLPSDLLLSRQAWQDLITTLCSTLPPSPDFVALLEEYNAFTPLRTQGPERSTDSPRALTHTSASGVVNFLWACIHLVPLQDPGDPVLSMLGLDAGWAAATAQWFFRLEVQLRDTFNGPYLLTDRDDDQCQIVLHFLQPGIPVDTGVPIPSVPLVLR